MVVSSCLAVKLHHAKKLPGKTEQGELELDKVWMMHAIWSSWVHHAEKSLRFSPSLRGSFVSFSLFSLLCWKALLGSNLRRGAPGSFDFSCSKSLFCRFTWDLSFDISYKHTDTHREGKRGGGTRYRLVSPSQNDVCGAESRRPYVSPVSRRCSHLSASSHVWSSASGSGGPADERKHQTTCLAPPGLLHFHLAVHLALLQTRWVGPEGTHRHKYWVGS